jgi:hypothetical protein
LTLLSYPQVCFDTIFKRYIIKQMQSIGDLLKTKEPKINIIPKKDSISFIAQKVKYSDDGLKNWRIIAKRLKTASPQDATKIYLSIQQGTIEWSKDYRGAFEMMCKRLPKEVKPKQGKLL